MGGQGLRVDDCRRTYEELTAKGCDVSPAAFRSALRRRAVMRDNSGNWLVLVEPEEFPPA